MKRGIFALLLIGLGVIPGCFARKSNVQKKTLHLHACSLPKKPDLSEPTITVWIHGTRLFPRPIFKEFFKGKPGLVHAHKLDPESYLHTVGKTLCQVDNQSFKPEHFYIFGWSGKLCFNERQQTADYLYNALLEKIREYERIYGKQPAIRLICHSHGGNVALNLANIHNTGKMSIDELIMLATPVQQRTLHCIKDPLFKRIFALYSTLDVLQILDPQGLYRREEKTALFSKRIFPHQKNLAQVKVRFNGRALFHNEFAHGQFLPHLPQIIDCIKSWLFAQVDPHEPSVRTLSIRTE